MSGRHKKKYYKSIIKVYKIQHPSVKILLPLQFSTINEKSNYRITRKQSLKLIETSTTCFTLLSVISCQVLIL